MAQRTGKEWRIGVFAVTDPALTLLREFRLFRSEMRTEMREMRMAIVELGRTVRSVPGLVDVAVEQGTNMAVLDARLAVVEEGGPGNGRPAR
jgi:hypothetical protein